MKQVSFLASICLALICCMSCGGSGDPDTPVTPTPTPDKPTAKLPISISTDITRATETAFENGDEIGLFVVNHNADGSAADLKLTGNHVDNMKYTYNGLWTPATQTYWKDNTTHADFYLYYPYNAALGSVDAMPWTVSADQSTEASYKAADLMVGKTSDVAPQEAAVKIDARHMMSQMVINLVAGNGFTEASLSAAKIGVTINRLKNNGSVSLATATVTAKGDDTDITPLKGEGNSYKALVVPQAVGEGNLITVNVDGRNFNLTKDSKLTTLAAGKTYRFTVTLSKTSNGVNVNITKWEDDGVDYGGTAE